MGGGGSCELVVVEATGGGRVRADDGGGLGAEVEVEALISDPRVVDEEEEDLK